MGRLTLSNGLASALSTLAGVEVLALLAVDDLRSLLHDLLTLGQDELDVARVRHVGVDLRCKLAG
jgi:hypothetical protein